MENKYFYHALQNFVFEEAGGAAIRHLADLGYTARQVADALSFPIPYEKVKEAFTACLLERSVLLTESPVTYREPEKTEFVREYDRYGRASFRRVTLSLAGNLPDGTFGGGTWRKMEFSEFLRLYQGGVGEIKLPRETDFGEAQKHIYIACYFGGGQAESMFAVLEKGQREYVEGICWKRGTMYHLLHRRMFEIGVRLQESGLPVGPVYFQHRG